jgi:hypothetical protein
MVNFPIRLLEALKASNKKKMDEKPSQTLANIHKT